MKIGRFTSKSYTVVRRMCTACNGRQHSIEVDGRQRRMTAVDCRYAPSTARNDSQRPLSTVDSGSENATNEIYLELSTL